MANCTLCKEVHSPQEDSLVWRGDDCRVVLVNDPQLPGFCRVIWNRHISEMTDLTLGERDHLMGLVFAVEEAIRQVIHPDKVNIAALGNVVPHIHWHVIPRFTDDAFFPGSVWSEKIQQTPTEALRERQKNALDLPAAIRSAIAALS